MVSVLRFEGLPALDFGDAVTPLFSPCRGGGGYSAKELEATPAKVRVLEATPAKVQQGTPLVSQLRGCSTHRGLHGKAADDLRRWRSDHQHRVEKTTRIDARPGTHGVTPVRL